MADIQLLHKQGKQLFDKRSPVLALWQTIADNFYPERADFTTTRNLGREFGSHVMTSYPFMARRDLGNSLSAMLRPSSKEWKHMRTSDWERIDRDGRVWLERATSVMNRAMYDRRSNFQRATKETDHDFATFGQGVMQVTLNRNLDGLLYRCWHLRDVAWRENDEGQINTVYRKWKADACEVVAKWPKTVHDEVRRIAEKDPYKQVEIWHIIVETDHYEGAKNIRQPYVSLYWDSENEKLLEEVGSHNLQYVIPRWSTVSGSQYAYSPAVTCALPDARLIQSMTRTILEAGEKAVTPPMVAVQEAIRGDIGLFAGGITWVDEAYDERLGEVLRPLTQDTHAIPLGMEMIKDIREMIAEAFFLNKLSLPHPDVQMTAYETGQRVQEYIRQAMPLFEPMETEYNGPMCEMTFELMLRNGAFGSLMDMPASLREVEIEFFFESPLHDAVEREKGQRYLEALQMLTESVSVDQDAAVVLDAPTALRDVLNGIGVPAVWQRSEPEAKKMIDARKQAQQNAELMQHLQAGAAAAKDLTAAAGHPAESAPVKAGA